MKRLAPAVLTLLALSACQNGAPVFEAASITLPEDSVTFPDRPGVEAVTSNCGACHSADMILNQPALTREQWVSSIEKMRTGFGATIDPAVEPAILDYLEATSAAVR